MNLSKILYSKKTKGAFSFQKRDIRTSFKQISFLFQFQNIQKPPQIYRIQEKNFCNLKNHVHQTSFIIQFQKPPRIHWMQARTLCSSKNKYSKEHLKNHIIRRINNTKENLKTFTSLDNIIIIFILLFFLLALYLLYLVLEELKPFDSEKHILVRFFYFCFILFIFFKLPVSFTAFVFLKKTIDEKLELNMPEKNYTKMIQTSEPINSD